MQTNGKTSHGTCIRSPASPGPDAMLDPSAGPQGASEPAYSRQTALITFAIVLNDTSANTQ